MLGIVVGGFVIGIHEPHTLLAAGLGASIAMGVSGFFGAYLTESAERERESIEWEEAMLEEFDESLLNQSHRFASIVVAVVDSLAPFLAALVCVSPFFIAAFPLPGISLMGPAFFFSFVLTAGMLFVLGVFLGRIAKRNLIISGGKMLLAGLLTGFLILFLDIFLP